MIWLASLTFALVVVFAIESSLGGLTMRALRDVPAEGDAWPRVSVVVAGRNEEAAVEAAMRSLLALDYPHLEIVAVDDRSTDRTATVLGRMAAEDSRLRFLSIRELPSGWLGKNWALHRGAEEASGELILFTDADVVFAPTALRRAVRYLRARGLDHLAVSPEMEIRSFGIGVFIATFAFLFSIFSLPWRARWRSSRHHVGVGAFNLVRTAAYRACGGHEPIRMRPDDDLKLGKLLKAAGGREELAFGGGMVRVAWYSTLGEAVRGLEKNAFSAVEYSLPRLVLASAGLVAIMLWPFVAPLVTQGPVRALYGATAALLIALVAGVALRGRSAPVWYALTFPAGILVFIYVIWRAALLTLARGGIDWRGTFYPLAALRANRV